MITRAIVLAVLYVVCVSTPLFAVGVSQNTPDIDHLDTGWYYLPSYANYAPCGMPDFDQKQDTNWQGRLGWSFCGPTVLADVFWWFDSKHSNPNGTPGDGIDDYTLISDLGAPSPQTPGPNSDDHNFNNVNTNQTPWDGRNGNKELIEELAWYTNTNFCKTPFIHGFGGTHLFGLKHGALMWIRDAGLQGQYSVDVITKPSFSTVDEHVRKNDAVILRLGFYIPNMEHLSILSYHYVVVAGINSSGYIAVSDPEWDVTNQTNNPTLHNNPSIVSHDVYQVNFTTPYPRLSSWWIPEFAHHRRVVVTHAIIISENE